MAKDKKTYDWEAIVKEYRAGQLSVREIAQRHGCSHTAINKKAKENRWQRDLAKDVRVAIRSKLVSTEVSRDNATDSEIIETAANTGVAIISLHRKDINSLRKLEEQIMAELGDNPKKLYITQYQGNIIEKEVGIAVTDRAAALNNLANVQHKRIQLERQAYSLDDKPDNGDEVTITGLPSAISKMIGDITTHD